MPNESQRSLKKGRINMTHGAGGRATHDLIASLFARHFSNEYLDQGHDGAVLPNEGRPIVTSCDGHVVKPLFFPGGDIGSLAVAGTVNDVAVCAAKPKYLTASFFLEEGFPIEDLDKIVESMAKTAKKAGVAVVAGDTKVVEAGKGDGLYIATTGIGEKLVDYEVSGRMAREGDVVIISGTLGDHGVAILSKRENMTFGTMIESDSAPLSAMIEALLKKVSVVHVLRDPTRGGLATTLNEIASQSGVGITLDEEAVPVKSEVAAACELLGLDPLYIANEGKVIVILPASEAQAALEVLRSFPEGVDAAVIGRVHSENPGFVEMKTLMGGRRRVDWLAGEPLPRIC